MPDDGATLAMLERSLRDGGLPLARDGGGSGGIRLCPLPENRVRVTWAVSDRLYTDLRRGREALDVLDIMNLALSGVLTALGWNVRAGAPGQATVVVGRRPGAAPIPPPRGAHAAGGGPP